MTQVTHTRIGLDLVGQHYGKVELFGELLKAGEELVQFLRSVLRMRLYRYLLTLR